MKNCIKFDDIGDKLAGDIGLWYPDDIRYDLNVVIKCHPLFKYKSISNFNNFKIKAFYTGKSLYICDLATTLWQHWCNISSLYRAIIVFYIFFFLNFLKKVKKPYQKTSRIFFWRTLFIKNF